MLRSSLVRWGVWPARLVSAVLIFYGGYLLIAAQIALSQPIKIDGDQFHIPPGVIDVIDGSLLLAAGLIVGLLAWLMRRPNRAAAIAGLVIGFFAAGLMIAWVLVTRIDARIVAGGLAAGAVLLLAGASTLVGRPLFESEANSHA